MTGWMAFDEQYLSTSIRIVVILVLGGLTILILKLISRRVEQNLERTIQSGEGRKRWQTIMQVGKSFGYILISLITVLELLHEMNINITPILASAGVAGVALSLGAQTFIKDYFGGLVILIEDQFSVGDVIKVADLVGTVERITLRATYLRDVEGRRITIPNGDIRTISNLSVDWARAVVTLSFPLDADMDLILENLQAAADEVKVDERISKFLLDTPEVQGWAELTDNAVRVKLMVRTKPDVQWEVARVLRQYALEKLHAS